MRAAGVGREPRFGGLDVSRDAERVGRRRLAAGGRGRQGSDEADDASHAAAGLHGEHAQRGLLHVRR